MLVGVVAFNVLKVMDPADPRSIGVLLTGYFFQGNVQSIYQHDVVVDIATGLGFFLTFFYICIYIMR
jgi:hypothetical protein